METPLIPTTEADEEAEVVDPEQVSEVEKILTDLADGVVDETLPRLTEKDVAFDMDEVVVEKEEIVEEEEEEEEEENADPSSTSTSTSLFRDPSNHERC